MSAILNARSITIEFNARKYEVYIIDFDKEAHCSLYDAISIAKFLGYVKPYKVIDYVRKYAFCRKFIVTNNSVPVKTGKSWFINKFGVMSLLTKSIGMSGARKEALLDALGIGIYFIPRNSRAEVDFIDELEDILSERNLHGYRQYPVLNYRIDYYLPEYKLAIEFDENDHRYYDSKKEEKRKKRITEELKCEFCRVSDSKSNGYNLIQVIDAISKAETAKTKLESFHSKRDDNGFIVLEEVGDLAKQAKEWYKKHRAG